MKYEIEEVRDFLVVHVVGDMTSKTHLSILDEAITDHIEEGFHHFVFNLEKVEHLDLDGTDIFICCLADVSDHGGGCYIVVEDDKVYNTLEQAGVAKLMKVYRNRGDFTDEHGITIED
jgi:anti-anti-sigma factor